jgi:hypothetical protein
MYYCLPNFHLNESTLKELESITNKPWTNGFEEGYGDRLDFYECKLMEGMLRFLVGRCHSDDEVFVTASLHKGGRSLDLYYNLESRGLDTSNISFRVREAMESVKESVIGLYHALPQSGVKD